MQTTNIAQGRNRVVRAFLEETDADWLWFVDTDETFPPDTLERLIASADPVERPIVSGLVFARREHGMPVSPACVALTEDGRPVQYETIPPVRHWPVGAVGAGCLLVHRRVLVEMGEKHAEDAWPWFKYAQWQRRNDDGTVTPDVMGEDYTFSLRARALGIDLVVDTTIQLGHVKAHELTATDFWPHVRPELRQRRTAAVIPVKNRAAMTRNLLQQLQGTVDLVLVMDNGSSRATRNMLECQPDVEVIDCAGMSLHGMWNLGADIALQRWPFTDVAFLNNDLEAGENMVPAMADALAQHPELAVVSPNYDGREMDVDVDFTTEICADRYDGTGGVAGFCFMVRGEFLAAYEFPDPPSWFYGDNDLLLAVQAAGLTGGITSAASVVHIDGGGKTTGGYDPDDPRVVADREAFMARWGAHEAAS